MRRVLPAIGVAAALLVAGALALGSDSPAPAPERGDHFFRAVTVVNPGRGRIDRVDVHVADGRVLSIGPSTAPRNVTGGFLLPGFVDAHVHPAFTDDDRELIARLRLMHGVTSVRYMAARESIFDLRADVVAGRRIGPRVFACGLPVEGTPPTFATNALTRFAVRVSGLALETPEDFRREVRLRAEQGAACIKVFINTDSDQLEAVREEAALHGIPLVGHVPYPLSFEQAALADVQHLTGVPDAPSAAFTVGPEFLPWIEAWSALTPERSSGVIQASLRHGAAHTPTLLIWAKIAGRLEGGDLAALHPPWFAEKLWARDAPLAPWHPAMDDSLFRAAARAFPRMLHFVGELHRAGVPIRVGTDSAFEGPGYHEELRLLVEAGLSPESALEAATFHGARGLGVPQLGVVAEGGPADLLLFNADPTATLDHLGSLETVVVDGRRYDLGELRRDHARALDRAERLRYRIRALLVTTLVGALL